MYGADYTHKVNGKEVTQIVRARTAATEYEDR